MALIINKLFKITENTIVEIFREIPDFQIKKDIQEKILECL